MGLDFFKRGTTQAAAAAAERKASATGRVVAWQSSGRVAWSPRDVVSLTRTGFAANPIGFRCVRLISEAAAALPLVLQDGRQRFEAHPLLTLVNRPNAGQGRAELLEALFGHLLLRAVLRKIALPVSSAFHALTMEISAKMPRSST